MELVLPIILFFFILNRLAQVQLSGPWKLGLTAAMAIILSSLIFSTAQQLIFTISQWPIWPYLLVVLLLVLVGGLGFIVGRHVAKRDEIF